MRQRECVCMCVSYCIRWSIKIPGFLFTMRLIYKDEGHMWSSGKDKVLDGEVLFPKFKSVGYFLQRLSVIHSVDLFYPVIYIV